MIYRISDPTQANNNFDLASLRNLGITVLVAVLTVALFA